MALSNFRRDSGPLPPMCDDGRMTLPTPTLEAERLRLRPFADADADDLFALQSDADVLRFWDSPPWTDRTSVDRFMAGCRRMSDDGSGARVAIERTSDQSFVGWCTFNSWNPDFRSASLGFCLNRRLGATAMRQRRGASCSSGPSTRSTSTGFSPRPIPAMRHRPVCSRSLASSARGHCARTASSTVTCLTPGCTACCDAIGRVEHKGPWLRSWSLRQGDVSNGDRQQLRLEPRHERIAAAAVLAACSAPNPMLTPSPTETEDSNRLQFLSE